MSFWVRYFKGRMGTVYMSLLFLSVFSVTFYMYNLPLGAIWYPAALCAVLGVIYLVIKMGKEKKKHAPPCSATILDSRTGHFSLGGFGL